MFLETFETIPDERNAPGVETFRIGLSCINAQTGRVDSHRGARWLRPKELELIIYFHTHVGRTLSREELLGTVWGYRAGLLTRTVDQTIATLRKKIEAEPNRPRFILSVFGEGYRLVLGKG